MLKQAFYIIKSLIKNKKNLNVLIKKNLKYKWSNKIKKLSDLNKFYEINLKCNIKEFKKKIRATNTENFKPFVYLHKRKFVLSE